VEWVEVTGKTVEDAKDRALDRLGVDERDAEFEVLEEPRTGFLGRVKGEARVRARVKPTTPRAKAERRDRGRRGRPDRDTRRARPATEGPAAAVVSATAEPASEEGAVVTARPSGSTRPRRRRGPGRSDAGPTGGDQVKDGDAGHEVAAMTDLPVDEQARIVATFLEGLLDAFGLSGSTEATQIDDDTYEVHVEGDELGLLVGPKGRTLQAVSEVARSVVVHQADGAPSGRVLVDVAGYRRRRRDALVRFTADVAAQVRSSGAPVALEPMSAADRKIVHDAVNDLDGVASTSEGEEPNRRVVILPAS
jgi:spoIIIJ-associated protein